jgi:hypothetical protein
MKGVLGRAPDIAKSARKNGGIRREKTRLQKENSSR